MVAQRDLISWCVPEAVPAFDVVRGDLASLSATAGDYSLATETCLAAAQGDPWIESLSAPPPGGGFWYLVRDAAGTYDTGEPSQIGSRDAEIAASGHDCS